ncbi:hypothetical protein [Bacillus mycoides]|uniref:hypothetical protein n=1 Tax=Bacillus mycoides TaxID=1405 RepID=UPI00087215B8|nr:hypothetical protein [Bacillus mycoides]
MYTSKLNVGILSVFRISSIVSRSIWISFFNKCVELKEVLTRRIKNAFVIMEFVERIVTFEETIVNVQRKSAL